MSSTEWKWRLMFVTAATNNTAENRQTFGRIFANNGSGETASDEEGLFNCVVKFSPTGTLPATAFGLNTAVKTTMRAELQTFLVSLSQTRWFGVMNTQGVNPANFDGKLIADNETPTLVGVSPWDTQQFTWQDVVDHVYTKYGLQVIEG